MIRGKVITVWQPVLTDHQVFTFRELALCSGIRVVARVIKSEDAVRREQGWRDSQIAEVERQRLPESGRIAYCNRILDGELGIHIFCSPFDHPVLMVALWIAILRGHAVYLISEPYSPGVDGYFDDSVTIVRKIKWLLRPLAYWLYGHCGVRRVRGVFAISSLSARQFLRMGVPAANIFLFGYFVPQVVGVSAIDRVAGRSKEHVFRIAFIGSLIRRKGLDIAIEATRRLTSEGVMIELDAYGHGDPSRYDFAVNGAKYRGRIPFGDAQRVIADYHAVVVPSRFDGWGVVVNEALCAGVPVICSDTVGARTLVETFGAGEVFESGCADALADAIRRLAMDQVKYRSRKRATSAAAIAIQPSVAAEFMCQVLDSNRRESLPSPWYLEAVRVG